MEGVGDCADSWGGDGVGGSGALAIGRLLCSLVYPIPLFYQKNFQNSPAIENNSVTLVSVIVVNNFGNYLIFNHKVTKKHFTPTFFRYFLVSNSRYYNSFLFALGQWRLPSKMYLLPMVI